MSIEITPQTFFDIFVLCLSWQWNPVSSRHMWTTVDKVVRILNGLGIITDQQKEILYKNKVLQQLFLRKSSHPPGHDYSAHLVLPSPSLIVIGYDFAKDMNRLRLLRDYRIYLTARGKQYAQSIESQYAKVITAEKYHEEIKRQGELEDGAKAAVMSKYRDRVEEET